MESIVRADRRIGVHAVGALTLACVLLLGGGCSNDGADDTASGSAQGSVAETVPREELQASFAHEPVIGEVTNPTNCPILATAFTDLSTGSPDSWEWQFPDGSTSTDQNPQRPPQQGNVTLTVTRGSEESSVTNLVSLVAC